MSHAALLRRNALSGIKRATVAEPLLPFLYNTRTIRSEHTDALSEVETSQGDGRQPSRRREGDAQQDRANGMGKWNTHGDDHGRRPRSNHYRGTRQNAARDGAGHDGAPRENTKREYNRMRQDHIPFEHAAQETISIRDKLASSTMTPSEKKAFEGLLSLSQQKDSLAKGRERDTLNEVLNEAASQREKRAAAEAKPMPEVLKKMQENMREDRNAAQQVLLEGAVEKDLEQIKEAFDAAQTDVELWKVLHDRVLARVKSLDLDNPTPKPAPAKPKKRKAQANTKSADNVTPQWPGDIPDQLVITETLPQHLVACQRQLYYEFPSSHLSTSLLPYLKSLGPTTFALAASTELYNLHMRALRQAGNLQAVISTLEEMDKEVYDFDDRTQDTLVGIFKRAKTSRTGTYGPGVAAIWNGERSRRATKMLGTWTSTVASRMQEKALREARAREEEESNKQAASQ